MGWVSKPVCTIEYHLSYLLYGKEYEHFPGFLIQFTSVAVGLTNVITVTLGFLYKYPS